MRKYITLTIFIFLVLSFVNSNANNYKLYQDANDSLLRLKYIKTKTISDLKSDKYIKYLYANDTIIQELQLKYKNRISIYFRLKITNTLRHKEYVISGIATELYNAYLASELGEDEHDNVMPLYEYHNQKYGLTISIEQARKNKRAYIREYDHIPNLYCPLGSVGLLFKE